MNPTKAQERQFERLDSCPYLGGDVRTPGRTVAASLRENLLLWDAFVVAPRHDLGILYELVDMANHQDEPVFLDVIYLATTEDRLEPLLAVIDGLKPDAVQTWKEKLPNELLANELRPGQVIIRAWWD
jgi:hypothetical protein